MDLGISTRVAPLLEEVRRFVSEEVAPLEQEAGRSPRQEDPVDGPSGEDAAGANRG